MERGAKVTGATVHFVNEGMPLYLYNKNPLDDVSSMLGIRHFKVDRDKIRNKRVIHGHTPVDIDCIKKTVQSDVYDSLSIDNGVIYTRVGLGNLVAYNIDTKELVIQPKID